MLGPILNTWISNMQRGFLTGRSMLSNIIDIDFHAMRISMKEAYGGLVLFDFAAAHVGSSSYRTSSSYAQSNSSTLP